MLYTEKEKHEIERVKEVFAEHLRQSPDFELLWSDKVGYVWLTIGVNPVYVDTGIRIESAADLCGRCLDDVATDVLYMTGNDHALEKADPLELAEIKRRWEPYINQLPDYAYLCKDLLNRLTGMFSEDRADFIASFDEYDLLIIDDLGVERSTEYAMEQMFFVIDSRYRSRRPMIITTNLKLSELKNPPDLAHARIYDRILERCAPILFDGKNFREENAGVTRQAAKDIVNSKHD